MKLHYTPLLQVQRDLHALPRGMDRFRTYLRTMLKEDGTDVELVPLVLINPMAKDHVAARLDALLAMDADAIAAEATEEANERLADVPGEFRASLVVGDDLMGGWTNRYSVEFDLRFGPTRLHFRATRRPWITGVLWSSEVPTERSVREAILTAAFRRAYAEEHGAADSLAQRMEQEGTVMAMAGCDGPVLGDEDRAYTRAVIEPLRDAQDMRTTIECLFGDAAGATLGFTPRGLSPNAGLALALWDARHAGRASRGAVLTSA